METLFVLACAVLVMFMQAGFALLTAGLVRSKNVLNVMMCSFVDYTISSVVFFVIGYALMFGDGGFANAIIGFDQFFLIEIKPVFESLDPYAFWFFQASFCGAAATIGLGSMVERLRFPAHLLITIALASVVYPLSGHWIWGGGWLQEMGFVDFAGSTQVHLVGAITALLGTLFLGPRLGKFNQHGRPKAIAGHSMMSIILGAFILWFGWYGFNIGSAMSPGDTGLLARIAINTHLAACAGGVSALCHTWIKYGKADCTMVVNGVLTGLVAITAGCHCLSPEASLALGAVSGWVTVSLVTYIERLRVDDPVGVITVHGFGGILGTLAIGLLANPNYEASGGAAGLLYGGGFDLLGVQALGVFVVLLCCGILMTGVFFAVKALVGLRIDADGERRGLDIEEHGMEAYHDFQIFTH